MSDQPPEDPTSDLIEQVNAALTELNITNDATRDAVAAGLKEALDALAAMGVSLTATETKGAPSVAVVEGGRAEDAPPTGGAPPDLHIAEPPSSTESADPTITTRVLVGQQRRRSARAAPNATGRIVLEPGTRQTILSARRVRSYRLHCTAGALRVLVDGQPLDTITTGQSIDVEGTMLQVSATDSAAGSFQRL
jgi:hypothetical protein